MYIHICIYIYTYVYVLFCPQRSRTEVHTGKSSQDEGFLVPGSFRCLVVMFRAVLLEAVTAAAKAEAVVAA